jgi:peptidoglycan/LPS O-acetylase OafA/YrhL
MAAAASVSFSLYLTHFPLLLAFNRIFPADPLGIGAATLACAVAFGVVFERRKDIARRLIIALAAAPFRAART